jgi:hypothetical protein
MQNSVNAANTGQSRTAFVIEPRGTHKFAYAKVAPETGEQVWRWPREPSLARVIEAKGQFLDMSV